MAEIENNNTPKSKRDSMAERLKSKYPDREFADDEAMYDQISADYDDYDKQLEAYKGHEESLSNMFNADPRSAHFLSNWRDGGDPVVELVRQFGTDIKEAIDDPERLEEIANANKEYVERVAKNKELEEQYQTNLQASLETLDKFQSANDLTDEQVDDVMEFLQGIISDGILGKFTEESMDMALKAINHDADVATADADAEVRGRNAKIDEKLRKRNAGDGTAPIGGTNNTSGASQKSKNIFDLARGAQ